MRPACTVEQQQVATAATALCLSYSAHSMTITLTCPPVSTCAAAAVVRQAGYDSDVEEAMQNGGDQGKQQKQPKQQKQAALKLSTGEPSSCTQQRLVSMLCCAALPLLAASVPVACRGFKSPTGGLLCALAVTCLQL
jgi:hypothetical protein